MVPDVQEMGIEMKGTRRGDKRWGDTNGGKVMVRGKKRKKMLLLNLGSK